MTQDIDNFYIVYIVLIVSICMTINFVVGVVFYYKFKLSGFAKLEKDEFDELNSNIVKLIELNKSLLDNFSKIENDMMDRTENIKILTERINMMDKNKNKFFS